MQRIPSPVLLGAFALLSSGCLGEDEVCTTHDGLACDQALTDMAAMEERIQQLEDALSTLQGECLTSEDLDLDGYLTSEDLGDYVETDELGDVVRLLSTDPNYAIEDDDALRSTLLDLDAYRIASDTTVTISLAGDTFTFDEPLRFTHADGGRIQLVGAKVGNTVLEFPSSDGIVVAENSALGLLTNVAIQGNGKQDIGILVDESSSLTLGDVAISDFYKGIEVVGNASLDMVEGSEVAVSGCFNGVVVKESGFAKLEGASSNDNECVGFYGLQGHIQAEDAVADGNDCQGVLAEDGAIVDVTRVFVDNTAGTGVFATTGSLILAGGATSQNGDVGGFLANHGSNLYASESFVYDVDGTAYDADSGSYLAADSATVVGADIGFYADIHSSIRGSHSNVTKATTTAYKTRYNGYIWAYSLDGDRTGEYLRHETTDFLYAFDADPAE